MRGNGGGVVLQFRSNRRIVGVASNRIEIRSRSGSQATRVRQFSQGTVAQEGAAEGWEKQQDDFSGPERRLSVWYRTNSPPICTGLTVSKWQPIHVNVIYLPLKEMTRRGKGKAPIRIDTAPHRARED
jgi:hypothetical protein